jgi:hypothetical protein
MFRCRITGLSEFVDKNYAIGKCGVGGNTGKNGLGLEVRPRVA